MIRDQEIILNFSSSSRLPPHEVQKAEREIEKAGKKRKSIFLRDFTISKSFNHFFFYL
jgi:hypothetical protein